MTSVNDFKNDMLNKYGVDLEQELRGVKIEAFYTRTRDILELEINSYNPRYSLYNKDTYEPFIYKAILEQAYYTINNTDFSVITGINFQTGTIMPLEEIQKRVISPIAHNILKNAGLFFGGLSSGGYAPYRDKRGY
jgi:hypothetical protein